MPYASVRDILNCADENGFAAAAVDIINYETALWVVKAAEAERLPVILMFYPGMKTFIPLDAISWICRRLAEGSEVPVGVHMDHCGSFEDSVAGLRDGFESVMFDGSALPFEENVAITSRAAQCAHIFGAGLEAELGHVGSGSSREDFLNADSYTDPELAREFIEKTGADYLAVAIGNSHGFYVCEPSLDIGRLCEINKKVGAPLVLHGGSGIPPEQVRESVKYGINKVNIATEIMVKCKDSMAASLALDGFIIERLEKAGEEVTGLVRERKRWINPSGYRL